MVLFISIHALLAESDHWYHISKNAAIGFLSTLSLRRATANSRAEQQEQHISIHALLAESDSTTIITICIALRFLSTLSLRRATYWPCVPLVGRSISIHALLAESDCFLCCAISCMTISIHALLAESDSGTETIATKISHFYPRSPCGERLTPLTKKPENVLFLSTLSLRRATLLLRRFPSMSLFLSTLSLRRATGRIMSASSGLRNFYPRSPCGERRKVPILGIK